MRSLLLHCILAAVAVLAAGCEGEATAGEDEEGEAPEQKEAEGSDEVKKKRNLDALREQGQLKKLKKTFRKKEDEKSEEGGEQEQEAHEQGKKQDESSHKEMFARSIPVLDGYVNPFDESRLKSVVRKWQGNWVVPGRGEGEPETAWKISGADVSVFWSKGGESGERTGTLKVISPCAGRLKHKDEETENTTTSSEVLFIFALGDDEAYATYGLSPFARDPVGMVTEEGFNLCAGASHVFVQKDSGCKRYYYGDEGYRAPEDVECKLSDESVEVEMPNGDTVTVERKGELLVGDKIAGRELRSFSSFDAAKSEIRGGE